MKSNVINKVESTLLKEICNDNRNEFYLIKDLLEIQRSKSLMQKRRGIREDIDNCIDNYLKIHRS